MLVKRVGPSLLAAGLFLVLASCASPRHEAAPGGALDAKPAAFPVLQRDAYVDPAVLKARRAVEMSFSRDGTGYFQKSDGVEDLGGGVLKIASEPNGMTWAMYRFDNMLPEETLYAVRLQAVQEHSEGVFYVALGDYESERWIFAHFDAGLGLYLLPIQPDLNVVSPGGNVYVTVIASDGSSVGVREVGLHGQMDLPPPFNLTVASVGQDGFALSWVDPALTYDPDGEERPGEFEYTGVSVFFSAGEDGPFELVDTVPAGVTEYFHTGDMGILNPCTGEASIPVFFRLATVRDDQTGRQGPIADALFELPFYGDPNNPPEVFGGPGAYTLGFELYFSEALSPPVNLTVNTAFDGESFSPTPFGLVNAGSVMSPGWHYFMCPVPSAQPDGAYRMAVRAVDELFNVAIFEFCDLVVLGGDN